MDLAFQCSPDHPYVREHPEWFRHRPDGSIQYAENPPKKYQDIYPFDFECEDWQALWNELLRVVNFWRDHGVRIFRVDNPHTKPFPFWEWLIAQVRKEDPERALPGRGVHPAQGDVSPGKARLLTVLYLLRLAERSVEHQAVFHRADDLARRRFLPAQRLAQYAGHFERVSPDRARAAYVVRAVLAATLCASYGIYGPAFELMDGRPMRHGSEEYLDSEKYQIRQWDLEPAQFAGRVDRPA